MKEHVCYVIMPFSRTTDLHTKDYWTAHFEHGLKPLIEDVKGLKARRSAPLRENVLKQIVSDLIISPVLVADLTDYNPNVYWELGVRQSFKESGTVTIAEEGTTLPFDIGGKATLFYPKRGLAAWQDFQGRLKAALRDCLTHPDKPDSPVFESVAGRGSLFEIFSRDQAVRRLDALLQELEYNSDALINIEQVAQENLQGPVKIRLGGPPLLLASTELLVVNRYIDENQPFYKAAAKYLIMAAAINDRLALLPSRPIPISKWLAKNIGDTGGWKMKLRTIGFEQEVTKARDRLLRRP